MSYRKTLVALAAVSLIAMPMTASAQFGGLAKKALGGSSGSSSISKGDADSFLDATLRSTKNVMISADLLATAIENREALASKKATIQGITEAKDLKALNAHSSDFDQNLKTIGNGDTAANLQATYNAGNAEQKQIIATAIANLALGVYRNVGLAQKAPNMVSGISSNPQMMGRLGDFKSAASLLGMQGKAFGKIGPALPKVMSALKIKKLPEAETTEPEPFDTL